MGWIGSMYRVLDALKAEDADKDEEGRFLVRGGDVVTFLGMSGPAAETVIQDNCEYCVRGEWKPLIPRLYGGMCVTVI